MKYQFSQKEIKYDTWRREELKDEMKNRISMALKDPILQQGFEIISRENAELKAQVSYLKDNLRVARKDREDLQLEVGKGLQEFIKDCPYTALKLYANEKYVEENAELKAKEKELLKITNTAEAKDELYEQYTFLDGSPCGVDFK